MPFGLPDFDAIRPEHYGPAFTEGMLRHMQEVRDITQNAEPATFANTVEAMERSGDLLNRVGATFFNVLAADSTPQLREVEEAVAPLLAAHTDAIRLDRELVARFEAVHADVDALEPEQRRLVERYHRDFVRAGAALDPSQQQRLRELNEELSRLGARYNTELLAEAAARAVLVPEPSRLEGLDASRRAAAHRAAQARGDQGYLLTMALPTHQPPLQSLRDRDLRRQVHEASVRRGSDGEHGVRQLVVSIVRLRAERAELLGFADHAAYVTADETAGSVEAVDAMLDRLVPPAVANARAEAEELTAALTADGQPGPLQPWDWAYYADRVRRERYGVDTEALKPYFELSRVVRDGVFYAARSLYGVSFVRRTDLPVYHPDVEVYDVLDADGSPLGLFLADWFARDSKRGGAWMSNFVEQSRLTGHRPVVVINLNVPAPAPGEPALMTLDEVTTAFHEFGHVLHGLFSDVTYPTFSGTGVPRDFVEYPSQVNEMWAWDPAVLSRYARHHETGQALDPAVVERIVASRAYGEGFATTEYLGAALLDQEWHRLSSARARELDPEAVLDFEQDALDRRGVRLAQVPPRYRTTYFAHAFSFGYAAAYYAYIWSEVLDAETVDWFTENGGLTRRNGERFRREVLSVGGSVDPLEAFERLRGRAPRVEPLLKRRGLR